MFTQAAHLDLNIQAQMGLKAHMSSYTNHLIDLTDALGAYENVSHWAMSIRLTEKGDLIDRLRKGGNVPTAPCEQLM